MYDFCKGYKMECKKKVLENGKVAKINSAPKINKKSKRPKCKRKVTFDSSMGYDIFSSPMERLIITQKVKLKKQKLKCTLNLTNIRKTEEKPRNSKTCKTEEKLSMSRRSEDRIVPQCMRKKCKLAVESKTKCCRQKRVEDRFIGKLKQSSKVPIKTNKRTLSKRNKQSYKSPKRISEKRNISYENISSDNFSIYSYVDEKLDTLIMRTKARERKQKNSFPKPLYTSTPIWQPADELEDITSISNEMDFSEDSQVTFILEPRTDNANNFSVFGEDVAASELSSEEIKVEPKCDVSEAILNINALSATNLVISVDPVIVKCEQNFEEAKANSECDVSQGILDIDATATVSSEQHLQKNTQDTCELNSKVIRPDSDDVSQVIFNINAHSAMDLVKSEEPPIAINKLNSKDNIRAREKKTEMMIKPNSKNDVSQVTLDKSVFSSKNLIITQENAIICPEHNTKNSKNFVNQIGSEIKMENNQIKTESSSSTDVYSETNKPISAVNSTNIMRPPVMIPLGPNRDMPEPTRSTYAPSQSAGYNTSISDEYKKWCENFNPTNYYYSNPESYYPPDFEAPNFMFGHNPSYDAYIYSGISYVPAWPANFIYNSGQYNSMESPINYLYLETPHFPATTYYSDQYIPDNSMYGHQPSSNCTSQMYSNTQNDSANDKGGYQQYHNNNKYPHKSQKLQNVPKKKRRASQKHTYKPYYRSNKAIKMCHMTVTNGNIDTVPITSERIKLEPKRQRSPVRIKIEENVHQAVQSEPKVIIKQEIIDNDYNTENNNNTVQKPCFALFERTPIVTNGMNNTNGDNLVRFIKQEPCD